ncbi:LysR family transcriptional regulator [Ottowia thiooxydans]|uniref:LysR family transcriptional regulator n=1 Tax=Ottowia thiooxydans TaxID=219182 RepID=UPI00068595A5|nr:LysR family transcriptional regulator [Ottowia thiooxydans]
MNVSLRQLRAFVLGIECTSFSAAAARMGMTQPGYSLLIRQLESELGLRLFQRTTRHVEPTQAGLDLLAYARRTLQSMEETCRVAEDARELRMGTLRLAVVPSVACGLLPAILLRFHSMHAGIRLELREEQATNFAEMVRAGRSEIGLGLLLQPDEALQFEPLLRDHLVALLPPGHPLVSRTNITWRSLVGHDYISVTTQSSVRVRADQAAVEAGQAMKPSYEVDSLTTAVALVRAGLGYAIVPSLALESLNFGPVVVRPVEKPRAWRSIGLLSRPSFVLSPVAEAFAALAREITTDWHGTNAATVSEP